MSYDVELRDALTKETLQTDLPLQKVRRHV